MNTIYFQLLMFPSSCCRGPWLRPSSCCGITWEENDLAVWSMRKIIILLCKIIILLSDHLVRLGQHPAPICRKRNIANSRLTPMLLSMHASGLLHSKVVGIYMLDIYLIKHSVTVIASFHNPNTKNMWGHRLHTLVWISNETPNYDAELLPTRISWKFPLQILAPFLKSLFQKRNCSEFGYLNQIDMLLWKHWLCWSWKAPTLAPPHMTINI